jgi:hypothetical protein
MRRGNLGLSAEQSVISEQFDQELGTGGPDDDAVVRVRVRRVPPRQRRSYWLLGKQLCSVAFRFCSGIGGAMCGKACKLADEGRFAVRVKQTPRPVGVLERSSPLSLSALARHLKPSDGTSRRVMSLGTSSTVLVYP